MAPSKVQKFAIEVTNPAEFYYGGEEIKGKLVLELSEEKSMKGIHIQCVGKSTVLWHERRGSDNVSVWDEEIMIDQSRVLFGADNPLEDTVCTLSSGIHRFPFQFDLPQNIPASFKISENCCVVYYLEGLLYNANFGLSIRRERQEFTVLGKLDLNEETYAVCPVQNSDSTIFCCYRCRSGPLSAIFRTARQGYVPGDWIPFSAEINNWSGYRIYYSYVRLFMTVTMYTHRGSSCRISQKCAEIERDRVVDIGTEVWTGVLQVPPLPPSRLPNCSIMYIEYYLVLHLSVCTGLDVPLEITIGTIPHHSVLEQAGCAQSSAITHQPIGSGSLENVTIPPPPSYQECVFGALRSGDDNDEDCGTANTETAISLRPIRKNLFN